MSERIVAQCDACGKQFAVPGSAAGKKIRCPACKGVIVVQAGGAAPTGGSAAEATVSRQSRRSGNPPTPKSTSKQSGAGRSAAKRSAAGQSKSSRSDRTSSDEGKRKHSRSQASNSPGSGTSSQSRARASESGNRKRAREAGSSPEKKKRARRRRPEPEYDDFGGVDDYGDATWGDHDPYAAPALPPRMKKKKKSKKPELLGTGNEPPGMEERPPTYSSVGDRIVNGGVLSGIGMMAGAAIWFFAGLAAGYIFFYPPILFLIGFGTFLKGLFGD